MSDALAVAAILISFLSLIVSAIGIWISWRVNSRLRPALDISAQNLPPYKGEEKTLFIFQNVGSADLVNPETVVHPSWASKSEIFLNWEETKILAPPNTKRIEYRLPDPPVGHHYLDVQVNAGGIELPKKRFEVDR